MPAPPFRAPRLRALAPGARPRPRRPLSDKKRAGSLLQAAGNLADNRRWRHVPGARRTSFLTNLTANSPNRRIRRCVFRRSDYEHSL